MQGKTHPYKISLILPLIILLSSSAVCQGLMLVKENKENKETKENKELKAKPAKNLKKKIILPPPIAPQAQIIFALPVKYLNNKSDMWVNESLSSITENNSIAIPGYMFKITPPKFNTSFVSRPDVKLKPVAGNIRGIKLQLNNFVVFTSDNRGKETGRYTVKGQYYKELLPDSINMIEMMAIPGGVFMMGSSISDIEQVRRNVSDTNNETLRSLLSESLLHEVPRRKVNISTLYMSRYEITQAQWRSVAALPKINRDLDYDPSIFKGSDNPVEHVTWEEAVEFCARLSKSTGRQYRLPTEAEWEYTARAGTDSPFHFGDSIRDKWVNYNADVSYGKMPSGNYRKQTISVGSLNTLNAFGLFDMHGNVREWCLDSWVDDYSSAPADGSVATRALSQSIKVVRGGGFDSPPSESRSSSRNKLPAMLKQNNTGFRIVAIF